MKKYEPFKYATEAGVNMYLDLHQLCQPDEFESLLKAKNFEDLMLYNIYFICQRQRISIKHDFIETDKESIFLKFNVSEKDFTFEVPIVMDNISDSEKLAIIADPPYNYFEIVDEHNNPVIKAKSAYVLDMHQSNIYPRPAYLDFEILYIGQADNSAKVPVFERLSKHETLQKIYADVISDSPEKDIYFMLCSFVQDTKIETRGTVRTKKEFQEEDKERLKGFLANKLELSTQQRTTITEAALIRYFQPKYNSDYKSTFPSKRHSSYDECYKLDLNAVSIEINGEWNYFTKTISTSKNHYKIFYLQTDVDRRKLFDYSVGFDL